MLDGRCTCQEETEASHSVTTVAKGAGERTPELVCSLVALKDLDGGCCPVGCFSDLGN